MKSQTRLRAYWRRLRDPLAGAGVRAWAWVAPRLSRRSIGRCGHMIGWLAYYLLPQLRWLALSNLDIAFGQTKSAREKSRIGLRSLQNFVTTMLLLFWTPRLTIDVLNDIIVISDEDLQRVREFYAQGKGVLFLTPHYGDWELGGLVMGFWNIPMNIVSQRVQNATLDQVCTRLREYSGNRIIPRERAVPKMVRALRHGEAVAALIDLNNPRKTGGAWIDFFGLPVFNNTSVAALALRTGAPIVYGVVYPLQDGRRRMTFSQAIECVRTGNYAADLQSTSQNCMDYCERLIRENPEHWHWSYKRWKRRPSQEPGRYPYYSKPLEVVR